MMSLPPALRSADFRRLWIAGLISDTGDWLLLISLPILVFQLTGSAIGTAVAFLVELIPPVLLSPVAGMVADKFDRRRTLLAVSIAQALALLPLLAVHTRADLPIVYVVIAVQAGLASVFDPTKNALLPTLVPDGDLVSANALIGLNQNLGRLIGGPIGGLLLAAGSLSTIVATDAVSFAVAALLIARVARAVPLSAGVLTAQVTDGSSPRGTNEPGIVDSADSPANRPTRDGGTEGRTAGAGDTAAGHAGDVPVRPARFRDAIAKPEIRGALAVLATTSVAQGIFLVLYVVFVARALHGDAAETGLLRGLQAIGSIGAGLVLAWVGRRIAAVRLTALASALFGVTALVTWNMPRLSTAEPIYIALFIAVGVPGLFLMTGLMTTVQENTPPQLRGRVFAAAGVAASLGQALGMLGAGFFGDRFGPVPVLNVQGCFYLLAALIAVLTTTRTGGRPAPAAEVPELADRR